MVYNTTKLVNGSGIVEITQGINDATGGLFSGLFLLVLFLVLMISFKNYETKVAFLTASTGTTFIASIMWGMQLISGIIFFPLAGMVFASLIWIALGDR